jgi:hypothetical protein
MTDETWVNLEEMAIKLQHKFETVVTTDTWLRAWKKAGFGRSTLSVLQSLKMSEAHTQLPGPNRRTRKATQTQSAQVVVSLMCHTADIIKL